MPNFGTPTTDAGNVGLGVVPYSNRTERETIADFHREQQRQRMNIPDIPDSIIEKSEEDRIWIYNVGPRTFLQPMGSLGQYTIHALPEDQVFDDKLSVSRPLIIDGVPFEFYPSEGQARTIFHAPPKIKDVNGRNVGPKEKAGMNLALEIIGIGRHVNASANLRPFGVFISEFPEQQRPEKGAAKTDWDRFNLWVAQVKAAQAALRKKCADVCQEANVEYSRGKFADVRHDELYQMLRLIKGTEAQYPWSKDTADKMENRNCIAECGAVLKLGALKCGMCGEKQVSDEDYEKEITLRKANRL